MLTVIMENPLIVISFLGTLLLIFILLAIGLSSKPKRRKTKGRKPVRKKTKAKGKTKRVAKPKAKPKKRKGAKRKHDYVEIDPHKLSQRYIALSQTEQRKMKSDYIGRRVEIPTYVHDVTKSDKGADYRHLELHYKHNRNAKVLGDMKISDYKDTSWMKREGQLRIRGVVQEIGNNEIRLSEMSFV